MKRKAYICPLTTLVFAAVGAVLRKAELACGFEEETGLAIPGVPVTIALVVISVAFAGALIALNAKLYSGMSAPAAYEAAFRPRTVVPLALSVLMAATMLLGGYMTYREQALTGAWAVASGALAILAALAGIGALALALRARGGKTEKNGAESCIATLAVTVFICFFIIMTYKERAADPVLQDYMYNFLGLCSAALASYYIAGFAYERANPKRTLYFCQIGVYFCAIGAVDAWGCWDFAFYAFLIVFLAMHGLMLSRAMATEPADIWAAEEAPEPAKKDNSED